MALVILGTCRCLAQTQKVAMAAISEEVKKQVDGVLNGGDPVLVKVHKLTSVLLESGLAYRQC